MDCGIITSKAVLLLLSLIFWAAGAALAYVGSIVINSYSNYDSFLEDKYTLIPAAVTIGVGVVMFIFGLVGCCATIRESKFGLSFFLLIILVIFAAEVAALVLGIIYQGRIKGDLERSMTEVFNNYNGLTSDSKAVDYLQNQLQCCGVQTYANWTTTSWFTSNNNTVPRSCCRNSTDTRCTGSLDQLELLHTKGCEPNLQQFLQDVWSYAMLVVLGFAIVKFFGMLSTCVITCKVSHRRGYHPIRA
ncbi:tetraspanin 36 [Polymixia lowei]